MPKSIEKPEYIKKALGLNRDAPIPVSCMDKVEQLAGSLAINISQYTTAKQLSLAIAQFQKTKNSKSSFIPVEKNRKTGVYETLEEAYQRIHEERNSFLQETKKFGLGIDLSYHNWSYKRTALWLFERLSVGIPANDPLDPIEAEWLSDAMMGGLIWADNEWKGYGRQVMPCMDYSDGKPNALIYDREARIPGP
ncbi:hypothetical protein GLOIN_2v1793417 [Rhizophagus irregularis DAOM 181602=DAOM 197198]|nr:hypothetical protein GLOIN_2v1793417 [Rhizophagus irregularis DAOM 181602=DAOM 197198]